VKNLYFATAALLLSSATAFATTLTINTPSNGATVSTAMRVTASTDNGTAIYAYVDDNLMYTVQGQQLDTTLNVSVGQHHLVLVTWDSVGNPYTAQSYLTAQDTPPPSGSGITISSPTDGATVPSPVQFSASAANATAMHIYVDNQLAYQVGANSLNTSLAMSAGAHYIVVQAWDQWGNVIKAPLTVNVGSVDNNASISQIQNKSGWDSCSVCAGADGNGPSTDHWLQQWVSSPSLTGSAAQFHLGGTPWGAALWWKQVGGNDGVYNLRYSLDFYVDNPGAAQALEFDVNQNAGGLRYIFGTECDIKGSGTWRVWNSQAGHWVSTGIYCAAPEAYRWNHLVWEFQRTGGGVRFVAVTLNGQRRDIDYWFPAYNEGGSGIDVAFQADLDGGGTGLSVWLDNVNLTYW
jgi:hypothetical protein